METVCNSVLSYYCVGTDIFLDREKEVANFESLSDNNFGIHLVKIFPGGRLEKWCDGFEVCSNHEMR